MTDKTLNDLDRSTLRNFNLVLQELTELIMAENHFLNVTNDPPPQPMLDRKEELSTYYANLTNRLRGRAAVLHSAGELNPAELEQRIRKLVDLTKHNQTLLNARKVATALRVDAVMAALAAREQAQDPRYTATGNSMSAKPDCGPSYLHLRA